jgi:hypothetical protein
MALTKLGQKDMDLLEVATEGAARWHAVALPSGELATIGGQLLVHRDKREMEFLLPNATAVPVPPTARGGPFLPLSAHPDMAAIRWPLNTEEFRA